MGAGQVLQSAYDFQKTRNVVREMADALALELVEKRLVTDQVVLTVGYDRENLTDPGRRKAYRGEITMDRYGRQIPPMERSICAAPRPPRTRSWRHLRACLTGSWTRPF